MKVTDPMPKSKPRLLLDLTPLATPGGARGIGRYIRELARGLAELDSTELEGIELLGLTALDWSGHYEVVSDLAAFLRNGKTALLTGSDYYSWAYRQRLMLWHAARRIGATAVHCCDPHATPRLLGLAGAKRIVTCHDIVPTRFPDHYFGPRDGGATIGRFIERKRYVSADYVIAVSEATKHDVCSLLGVPQDKVVRVYNGVALEQWTDEPALAANAVLQRHQLTSGGYALYVGGSDWRKNTEGMLAAIANVNARGAQLELAWAGHLEHGHRARVESLAAAAGVSAKVRFLGYVSDAELSVLYRHATVHLFVSRLEGFGLTVVEAMASGCPVLTTRGGSLAEVAGDAALTVDPEDPGAIADALLRLMREPALRADLIALGRRRAPLFSRQEQAKATAAAYRQFLMGEAPKAPPEARLPN